MGQPPTNDMLAEQIRRLREDFSEFKRDTRDELRDAREEMREIDDKVDEAAAVANKVEQATKYMRENIAEMKELMTGFTKIVEQQNRTLDVNMRKQGEKIDEFINSDKRAQAKKDLIVAVLTAIGSVVVAVITLWASGKF